MRNIVIAAAFLFASQFISAQNNSDKVKVFLDCTQSGLCDFDFVRTEIKAVDFVRDRFVADVHVLVNTQRSSTGGTQAEVDFMGNKRFQGQSDTLVYFNDPTATEDEQRKKLVQYLKLGLTRFVAKTSYAGMLKLDFGASSTKDSASTPTLA